MLPKSEKAVYVRDMFAAIAPRYDTANRVLTAGVDEAWRRRAVREMQAPRGGRILDLCCGTGDLAFHVLRSDRTASVAAVDFCEPMLAGARERARREDPENRAEFVCGDVMALPFGDDAFDGATMGFSMRNVVDIAGTLCETLRVLRPGARFVNLDVSRAPNLLTRALFEAYFYTLVPLIGGAVGGSKSAYRYLPQSLTNYPDADALALRFRDAGFADVRYVRLGMGAIALHIGAKPA
ncbi:MAG TPA: bifunctional demethylmenaquinone methyltransferase/2-methoxy-6-polyprenyl-1,4-benzoquinol methylase UbiE [Candidatus Binatia bacterium]|nr:bifunctional demethylmenaquinone methyltransferase/2-methoxy-6-polyprenyl-1,4-benzoquinol methylase UbiE [Candidatus Binatia bacterium]